MEMETAFRSEQRFTQAQFFDWLRRKRRDDFHHYELLGGHIVMTPPAGHPHGAVEARIVAAILQHVDARKSGLVLGSSAGFELPSGDTVEPDVSYVSHAAFAAAAPPEQGKFYRAIPDLVVEILSRSTARRDRGEKKLIDERNGVAEYWIVSPESRHVSVYVAGDGRFSKPVVTMRGSVRSTVVPGLTVPLDGIFADSD
jgi:Uma2 family endonuclease